MSDPIKPKFSKTDWSVIYDQCIDFDWYARDRRGHVAAFTTFGRGAIPNVVKSSRESYNELYDLIDSLEESTEADLRYQGPGRFDTYFRYSRRGLFAYDVQDALTAHRNNSPGEYELITCPRCAIQVMDLNLSSELSRILPIVDAEFGTDATLAFRAIPQ